FLTVQAPAMIDLLGQHQVFKSSRMHVYGLIFFLILLHALHVVGGMVALVIVTVKAHRGAYERPGAGVAAATGTPSAMPPAPPEAARRLTVGGVDDHDDERASVPRTPLEPGHGHDPIRHTTMYWHFLDGVWI